MFSTKKTMNVHVEFNSSFISEDIVKFSMMTLDKEGIVALKNLKHDFLCFLQHEL